jgi:hypothetical protein
MVNSAKFFNKYRATKIGPLSSTTHLTVNIYPRKYKEFKTAYSNIKQLNNNKETALLIITTHTDLLNTHTLQISSKMYTTYIHCMPICLGADRHSSLTHGI